MVPGPEVGGRSGWVDVAHGLSAIRRTDGEYAVLVEDDGFCKLTLYRWNPADAQRPPAPVVRLENGGLAWEADESVGSWTVQVLHGTETRTLAQNLRVCRFADADILDGSRRYQVLAVNSAGMSPPSAIIELKARPVGEPLVLRAIGSDANALAEAAKIIDGDAGTFSYVENPKGWVGCGLPDGVRPVRVRLLPRPGFGTWLRHGVIEGCDGDPAKGPWVPLLTVDRDLGDGWQPFAIADERAWRYLRWRSAAGRQQMLAEWQVLEAVE